MSGKLHGFTRVFPCRVHMKRPRSQFSTHSKLSPEQSVSHVIAQLPSRGVLSVSGPDALKFLQGYTTNDTRLLQSGHAAQFTAFLNGKGKTIAEAVLSVSAGASEGAEAASFTVGLGTPTGGQAAIVGAGPTVLIDVDRGSSDELLRHLRQYKLRAKVTISDLSTSHAVHAVLPTDPFSFTKGARSEDVGGHQRAVLDVIRHLLLSSQPGAGVSAFFDPRTPDHMCGLRVVCPTGTPLDSLPLHAAGPQDYACVRMLAGIPEGEEARALMPLEWNAPLLHAVSFDKGCYLGQELVARTHFRGLVRKRVVPVYLTGAGAPPRPPACADPVAAALVHQTDEAIRRHTTHAGGAGHGQGHGPTQKHVWKVQEVDNAPHHSRIQHGGHSPSASESHGGHPRHTPPVRIPFPWLDREWKGSVAVGDAIAAGVHGEVEGRPGRVVGWTAHTNLAMVLLRLDNVAHTLPSPPRAHAGHLSPSDTAESRPMVAGEEEEETPEQVSEGYQRVHARACTQAVDLHVGRGEDRHRVVPVLPAWWRHVQHSGMEEVPGQSR